jgi:hypothetical protein
MRVPLGILLIQLSAAAGMAGLEWESLDHQIHPNPEETQAAAQFRFKNAGPEPIAIRGVRSSCSCLVAEADKTQYAPGESGQIRATFVFGDRVGRQEHTIEVLTSDEERPRVALHLRGEIPKVIDASPRAVNWEREEPPRPKRVRISVLGGFPVSKFTVESSDPGLSGQVETVIEGLAYDLVVLPVDTGRKIRGVLRVKSDYPAGSPRSVLIYVGFR